MRFESLSIEKYGLIDSRTIALPVSPGLCVIYGPNEAGKSTCLAAISDFLFGIPHNSPLGQVFGYDQIRLAATLRLSDGTRHMLRRRKGRAGRTLTDENGQIVEEAVIARYLGSTSRDRFSSLFGLDHASLRTGGERLLAADGDIGRLIVEAGGGLRSLVEAIDALARDADALFSVRRSGERQFYKALDAYDLADGAVKSGLMTRDAFEVARQRYEAAVASLTRLRTDQRENAEQISRLERLVRVIPTIRELDSVEAELAAFIDLPALRADFPDAVQAAAKELERAQTDLQEAKDRCAALTAKIDALSVPDAILAKEAAIRDLGKKALHVEKARDDRPNRMSELAERQAKIETIRTAIGLAPDIDIEKKAPPADVIARVQRLATEGVERRAKITGQIAQIEKERRTLANLRDRQAERARLGTNGPTGVSIADFASIAMLSATTEGKERQVQRSEEQLVSVSVNLGFKDLEELSEFPCPDSTVIQSEIDRLAPLEASLSKVEEKIAVESARRDSALASIERLSSAGNVPSVAFIAQARQVRDQSWGQIRDRYLSWNGEAVVLRSAADRQIDVDRYQTEAGMADGLADRKSLEADRIAALELAQRQSDDAIAALAALENEKVVLEQRRIAMQREWSSAWPVAVAKVKDLGRLKSLVDQRKEIIREFAALQALRIEIEGLRTDLGQRISTLEQAEQALGLSAGKSAASLTDRVASATRAVKAHEDAYADYRQDEKAGVEFSLTLMNSEAALGELRREEANWRPSWSAALAEIGLADGTAEQHANEIATQWATASGLFDGIRLTRARLGRMNDDEADLRECVARVSAGLDLTIPEDAVAAAEMLSERLKNTLKIAIERESLEPELKERTSEYDSKLKRLGIAEAAIISLCEEAGCECEDLVTLTEKCQERLRCTNRKAGLLETIIRSGDGFSVQTLREQWGGKDLDVIRADVMQAQENENRIAAEIEQTLGEVQECKRNLDQFSAVGGVNAPAAARESAIAKIHDILERYLETAVAQDLLAAAIERIRSEQQDPLISRAGNLFSASTQGAFVGVEADIDESGTPIIVGKRSNGDSVPVGRLSDGARDQLFLAFRIASIEKYCLAAEPLPFVADDILVHFDDDRSQAALGLLAELGRSTQVLLFTHHRHIKRAAELLVAQGSAVAIDVVW